MWKPIKLQGLGPGGIVGAAETGSRPPARGSALQHPGLGHRRRASSRRTRPPGTRRSALASAPLAGVDGAHPVLAGRRHHRRRQDADAPTPSARTRRLRRRAHRRHRAHDRPAARAPAASSCRPTRSNLQITNDVLESDGGVFGGGIGARPAVLQRAQRERSSRLRPRARQRRPDGSGGIGIFRGSNNYEIANSILCSNFGVEYGAGISHWGLSPGGSIHDNQIYYNDAVDSGAGIAISQEQPLPRSDGNPVLGDGSGSGRHRPQPDPEQLLGRRRRRHLRDERANAARSTSATT